jgi:SAM-dependent methyltransferase
VSADERRERGVFFTPRVLVERVLDAVAPLVPKGPLRIIDPACGAGAFLAMAAERWPRAELIGVELNELSAQQCRERVPRAKVIVGDALMGALPERSGNAFELWIGNPPYNGTSPLLRSKDAWNTAVSWLPSGFKLPKGQSLREDFVFFMLKASTRLQQGPGALAFITSATLLDTFAYAAVREALLQRMQLREVIELERGLFEGTRVLPCVTVWSAPAGWSFDVRSGASSFQPVAPEWRFKPPAREAQALEDKWRKRGESLDQLVPVSFPGLKTRFDELLVDDDRRALEKRVKAFLAARDVRSFAREFELGDFVPKLEDLKEFSEGATFKRGFVRPFLRYRGPNPRGPNAWCYVDRRLIPRGDHRMRGEFDPHGASLKLVFNWRELPLAAHVIEEEGCVTMYRHSRFAPAMVPRALIEDPDARDFDPEDLVPNLSARGKKFGTAREVFTHIAKHVMSKPFQETWAPAFGTSRVPVIPLPR